MSLVVAKEQFMIDQGHCKFILFLIAFFKKYALVCFVFHEQNLIDSIDLKSIFFKSTQPDKHIQSQSYVFTAETNRYQ